MLAWLGWGETDWLSTIGSGRGNPDIATPHAQAVDSLTEKNELDFYMLSPLSLFSLVITEFQRKDGNYTSCKHN